MSTVKSQIKEYNKRDIPASAGMYYALQQLKKMKTNLYLLFLLFPVFISCNTSMKNNASLFDAAALTSHPDPDRVEAIMREKPDSAFYKTIFGVEKFIQLYYNKDSAEFRFHDNKLEEVIVNDPSLVYRPESITQFGLPFRVPTEEDTTAFFMWKNDYEGINVINFYKVGSKPDDRETRYKIYFKLSS